MRNARVTWGLFHALGFLLLWLAGRWPSAGGNVDGGGSGDGGGEGRGTHGASAGDGGEGGGGAGPWPLATIALLTLVLYVWVALSDPGYLSRGDEEPVEPPQSQLKAAASPLLDMPLCMHCFARQTPRAKVRLAP